MPLVSAVEWEVFLESQPQAHLLQSAAWGSLKSGFGWQIERVRSADCGAQILFRGLPLGFSVAYIPKGPIGTNWAALWPEIEMLCRKRGAIFLKIEPDAWDDETDLAERLPGFSADGVPVQPRRTITLSLEGDEEEWLLRMKQKTRYNIRLAAKKGVVVEPSADVEEFHALMQVTGSRDGFSVHSLEYYRRAYELFHTHGQVELLIARYEGRPLAGLMVFARGSRSWYFYGASNDEERNRMPAYLLQWEAMRWAASQGCTEYDLWGVPDAEEEQLEAQFEQRSDGLWGVYRFKRGFGGQLLRAAPTFEKALNLPLYHLYRWWARRRGVD